MSPRPSFIKGVRCGLIIFQHQMRWLHFVCLFTHRFFYMMNFIFSFVESLPASLGKSLRNLVWWCFWCFLGFGLCIFKHICIKIHEGKLVNNSLSLLNLWELGYQSEYSLIIWISNVPSVFILWNSLKSIGVGCTFNVW